MADVVNTYSDRGPSAANTILAILGVILVLALLYVLFFRGIFARDNVVIEDNTNPPVETDTGTDTGTDTDTETDTDTDTDTDTEDPNLDPEP
jgi:hypothetical protein